MAELAVLGDIRVDAADRTAGFPSTSRQLLLGDRHQVHDVWPVANTQVAIAPVHLFQLGVLRNSMSAVQLYGVVNDLDNRAYARNLDHGDVALRRFEALLVGNTSSEVAELLAHGDLHPCLCNHLLDTVLLCQQLTEGLPPVRAVNHGGERLLRHSKGPHAMVDPPWTESALRNLEAAALAQDDVAFGHAHVVEDELGVVVLLAEDRQRPQDLHARRVARHEDHGLLLVHGAGEAGLAERHEDLALRPDRSGDPPLVAVDDVVVAVRLDPRRDVRGIAGGNARLSHRKGRADLAVQQRLQPLLLLLLAAEPLDHLHVAGVGRGAVHGQVCRAVHAEDLSDGRILEHGQLGHLRQEQVHDAAGLGLGAQLVEDGRLRALCRMVHSLHELALLLAPGGQGRVDDIVHKVEDLGADLVEAGRQALLEGQQGLGKVLVQSLHLAWVSLQRCEEAGALTR
mmetsp:Transcript_76924/g.204158  ORF Transcript_76924/g.204158 Transcript_76924/m.204158 type:complete len:455 (+) Transcript_76924:153-1517(+)